PGPHLVLVQADLTFGLREALLDLPPHPAHAEQLRLRSVPSTVGQEEAQVLSVVPAPSDQHPTPHAWRARLGERQARPDLPVLVRGPDADGHGSPRGVRETLGELRPGLPTLLIPDGLGARHHQRVGSTLLLEPASE